MKRYRIEYWNKEKSKPQWLTELSIRIMFSYADRKRQQFKFKNDLLNGIRKIWCYNKPKNYFFLNYKKSKEQGIKINFKR